VRLFEIKREETWQVAVIVAHPDDETLWVGGTILSHPLWSCFVVCLCRRSDQERAEKFYKALKVLKSRGIMGNLDDGPDQKPLSDNEVEGEIMELLPHRDFDLIITHNPAGEYTRHIRHEEVSKAVLRLWQSGKIAAPELWTFAYEDGMKQYFPRAMKDATFCHTLTREIWMRKYRIITNVYGFENNSWEAETTPISEAFRKYAASV
jgi:LmbE family N-acetylglucosaminyl deacetylase